MEGGTARQKPFFRIVLAIDHAHVLTHDVAVVVRRAEGVFHHHPSGGKDDEVRDGHAGDGGGAGQDSEDGGILMCVCVRRGFGKRCKCVAEIGNNG